MTLKFTRESILVIISALMLLFALFYYGNLYLLEPIKEESSAVSSIVDSEKILLEDYPPKEELLAEYKAEAQATEAYLPVGDQANTALITLERLAKQSNVEILSVSRSSVEETTEDLPAQFVKNNYLVEVRASSSQNLRSLMERLISEERIWDIPTLSYNKSSDDNYTGSFNYDLYYVSDSN